MPFHNVISNFEKNVPCQQKTLSPKVFKVVSFFMKGLCKKWNLKAVPSN